MKVADRVRFSPAPSGVLHVGGARTALFNHLVAQAAGGVFIVRFEDTDTKRSDLRHESGLLEDLKWLGLRWDEGPDVGGPHAPYRQSQRAELYARVLGRLESSDSVYRCFCPDRTLVREREADTEQRRQPRYRGPCRSIPADESRRRAEAGEPFGWRFAVQPDSEYVVDDAVHGRVVFSGSDIGDFLVARSDGMVLYDLACVVDDDAMGITLVIRGDDHLSNTPRQLMIFEALGARPPRYAHVPLVIGADGRPLSKSRGAESIASLRSQGYLPSAVVNHLALLGWSDPQGREILSLDEIAAVFDLSRVSPSPPAHDVARLRWLNKRHMSLLTPCERIVAVAGHVPDLPGATSQEVAGLLAEEVEVAGDVVELVDGLVEPPEPDGEAQAALGTPTADAALSVACEVHAADWRGGELRDALRAAGLAPREAMPAVRAALTGRAHGLPLATIRCLLGAEETRRRLELALRA